MSQFGETWNWMIFWTHKHHFSFIMSKTNHSHTTILTNSIRERDTTTAKIVPSGRIWNVYETEWQRSKGAARNRVAEKKMIGQQTLVIYNSEATILSLSYVISSLFSRIELFVLRIVLSQQHPENQKLCLLVIRETSTQCDMIKGWVVSAM